MNYQECGDYSQTTITVIVSIRALLNDFAYNIYIMCKCMFCFSFSFFFFFLGGGGGGWGGGGVGGGGAL